MSNNNNNGNNKKKFSSVIDVERTLRNALNRGRSDTKSSIGQVAAAPMILLGLLEGAAEALTGH